MVCYGFTLPYTIRVITFTPKFTKAQKSGIWKFYDENGEFDYDIDYDKRATPKISIDSSEFKNAINK